jgi:molecular chaperone GrpE
MSTDDQRDDAPKSAAPTETELRADPGATPESASTTIERLREQLAQKETEAAANLDRYLRERAELENVKKRLQREKTEAVRFACEALVRDLLPIIDNLERAVEHAEGGGNGQPLVEGVRLVLKGALDVLERNGVRRIEAKGERFDPSRHEALAQVPDPGREPNEVVEQFLPGYQMHERLLRPAQVSVSTPPPVENPPDDD